MRRKAKTDLAPGKIEHCLVLIKPDGVELSLTGEVITHLDREELMLVGMKAVQVNRELAAAHYAEHRRKPFFQDIIKYLMGGYHSFPWVYAFVFCGPDACCKIRAIIGRTNPMDIDPGKKIVTLRQKYGRNVIVKAGSGRDLINGDGNAVVRFENVIHASFPESAEYEVKLWFSPAELLPPYRLYDTAGSGRNLAWRKSAAKIGRRCFPIQGVRSQQ